MTRFTANRWFAAIVGLYVLIGGAVSLLGWALDFKRLTNWSGDGICIQPNAAICATLSGLAVLLLSFGRQKPAGICGAIVGTIGFLTGLEWITGLNFGIDTLAMFGRDWIDHTVISPGRMGPPGSLSWTLIGASLFLTAKSWPSCRFVPLIALVPFGVSLLSLTGYFYGADLLYTLPRLTAIALQTAGFIAATSMALMLLHPDEAPARWLWDSGATGVIARWALPSILVVPVILSWLRLKGERLGYYDTPFGIALLTWTLIGLLGAFLWWSLATVKRYEELERSSAQRVIDTLESVSDGFVTLDSEWRYTSVNAAAERLMQVSRFELLGRSAWDCFPESRNGAAYRELHRAAEARISVEFEDFNPALKRWFTNKVSPREDGGLTVYFQDITERKQTETEARLLQSLSAELVGDEEAEAFYKKILETAVALLGAQFGSLQRLETQRGSEAELELLAFRGFSPEAAHFWKRVRAESECACGMALKKQQRVVVPDILTCEFMAGTDHARTYLNTGIRAVQTTPLVSRGGQLLGAISTHWDRPHEPTERELRSFDLLARQVADLLERLATQRQMASDVVNLQRLVDTGLLCSRPNVSQQECLEGLLDTALAVTGAEFGGIQLVDESTQTLKIAVQRGFSQPFLDFFAEVSAEPGSACGTAMRDQQRIVVGDVTHSEIFDGQPSQQVLLDAGVRAVQSTPLIASTGRIVGMLSTHFAEPHVPDERTLRLIDLLAREAADYLERQQAEFREAQNQQMLFGLIERCPFGIYIVDSDFRIATMNAGGQTGAFANVQPVIGRPFDEAMRILWPEPVAAEVVRRFRHTLDTGEPFSSRDFVSPRRDGDQVESYEWELHRMTLPSGEYGVVCYYFNSTALRRAEQELREADRRKDEFLATLAHELRNPLAPIRNMVEVLKQAEQKPQLIPQARETMDRQLTTMARLIDDLLDLSRVTRNAIVLRKQPIELKSLVEQALEVTQPFARSLKHEISVTLPPETVWLEVDPVRIVQAISNLLNNACKYTGLKGHVWLDAERQGSDVLITINDTGIGIPPDQLECIFEMFAQLDRSSEQSRGGLGIGLTLVKRVIELHGGTVTAHSEGPGKGSRFEIRLPAYLGAIHAPSESAAPAEPPRGRRILIVDDNVDSATSLSLLLQFAGNTVELAHDGKQAVQRSSTYRPDIVLLDIGLPRLNGLEVCRQIRQQPWGHTMVIVALSGWSSDSDRGRSTVAGFDGHLVKPVAFADLCRLLQQAASRPQS